MKKILFIILIAMASSYSTAFAQVPKIVISDKDGWHKIGHTRVNFEKDRDAISVIGSRKFSTIKFQVTVAPIIISDLEVYYSSGDMQKININETIKSPGESRVIDLKGGERNLKKVVFIYKTLPNRKDKKAHVQLWGYKTNASKK